MKGLVTLVAVVLLGLPVGSAQAASQTFDDCDSAHNYGWNTQVQAVSSVMNRVSCSQVGVEKGLSILAKTTRKQKIHPHNPEWMKVCFYRGLYLGYIDTLVDELGECDAELGISDVAVAAAAVFTALNDALDGVSEIYVDVVFDGVFVAPDDVAAEQCQDVLASQGVSTDETELIESVCHNE